MNSSKIRVLIVDDSSFMRSILKRMIEKDERFEVVASAKDGAEGVRLAKELKPNVITMDIEMPEMNGLDALEHIMAEDPRPVIMVSSLTEEGASATMRALELGAVDFLPKAMQDTEKNILQSANILHEKLVSAMKAGMHMERLTKPIISPASVAKPVLAKPQPIPVAPASVSPAPVVGTGRKRLVVIGSSTGGPKALASLIPELPVLSVPVVIAQHMPPKFTKAMAERLDSLSPFTVKEAEQGEMLQAGTVYIAPGGEHMRVKSVNGKLTIDVQADKGESVYKPSVEVLSQSVLDTVGKDVVAVMLTGMGTDGSEAFGRIHQAGGFTIAQDKDSCVVYGMSRAVVEKNAASAVLSLENIGKKLVELTR